MGIFGRLKKGNGVQSEVKKDLMNNELNENDLFNVAGGMSYSPEEAKRSEELVRRIVNNSKTNIKPF